MKSLIILIFSHVLLIVAMPKKGDFDWFFNKDFRDNSDKDNDASREFFRHPFTSTTDAVDITEKLETTDLYTPQEIETTEEDITQETETTEDDITHETETTEEITKSSDYDVTEESATTEEITTEPETVPTTTERVVTTKEVTEVDETTEDIPEDTETEEEKEKENPYYALRKKTALYCKEAERVRLSLNVYGQPDCQLCTCNGEGVLMCTRISCDNLREAQITALNHKFVLDNSDNTNLILREYATGCKPGRTVRAGKCSCSCVMPSVMSCPKTCYDLVTPYTTPNSDDFVLTEKDTPTDSEDFVPTTKYTTNIDESGSTEEDIINPEKNSINTDSDDLMTTDGDTIGRDLVPEG